MTLRYQSYLISGSYRTLGKDGGLGAAGIHFLLESGLVSIHLTAESVFI